MQKIKTKAEYDALIEDIRECMEFHSKKNFNDIAFNLTMDNGERIRIIYNNSSVAHLLGIDTEYLKSTGMFKDNSYEILRQLCNDSYRLYSMVSSGHIKYDNFISDYAYEKVKGFKSICGIDLYNIEFICKYEKYRSYTTGNQEQVGDYYIAYKTINGLFVIGLKRNGPHYYPITNRYVSFDNEKNMEFLNALLENQHITIPRMSNIYFFNTDSYSKSMYIDYHKKASMLRTLGEYQRQYNAEVDVLDGYQKVNEKLLRTFNSGATSKEAYKKVLERISKRCIINIKALEKELGGVIPEDMLSLIETYNNSVNDSIEEALDEHTREVISERDKLSLENKRHIDELDKLKQELFEARNLIQSLQSENAEYKEREEEIVSTMKRIYKI